ncbi:class I SAM-dependent DNA methyltransferase [Streptomyces antimicrobicus]|uniref:Class I SAM-dependent methyltransferase n=1 Tax=Streptomyces antimicrobicus TaxID=2883108 RepID=A0ABS8B0X3_9ACTN|nr:class I SAM-dependent methyltransferase [Streptomyces antimicrobicus]MCB5178225.1 class I SAM-dependent methyltransferase [Streptomyces antimicrobicus]
MTDADGHFSKRVAERYDDAQGPQFQKEVIEQTADLLAELAGDGRALELGIGTGRIALPLARRGVPVHGIDMSRAMVDRMRAKPGGEQIGVSIGDFAATRVDTTAEGPFSLVYLVFNTIMNLASQEAQVACFRNAAEHLAPGGCFVVEVLVPELRKIPAGQNIVPFRTGPREWAYTVYDTVTQDATCHYIEIAEDGHGEARTIPFRYVWPSELDLMAQLAGLRLRDRWDGWTRLPFTEDSAQHVSVWEKPIS